jgi:hypothetical protein
MDITYLDDAPGSSRTGKAHLLRRVTRSVWQTLRRVARLLTFDPLSRIRFARFRNEDGSPLSRFVRGVAYRLAFAPVVAALVACAIVWTATHPLPVAGQTDPGANGLYFENVTIQSDDGARLDAWLVPAIDARRVIENQEQILREKHPAALLVHDFANRREQMLPLIRPLHDAGFTVMVLSMRGCAPGGPRRGQTFGLRESGDVKLALEHLRKRTFVDPERVTIVGVGTGANAALIVASSDKRLAAVVMDDPVNGVDEVIESHVVPQRAWLRWIRPLCKWTFEIGYEVDGQELNLSRYAAVLREKRLLTLDGRSETEVFADSAKVERIREFLVVNAEEKSLKRVVKDDRGVAGHATVR